MSKRNRSEPIVSDSSDSGEEEVVACKREEYEVQIKSKKSKSKKSIKESSTEDTEPGVFELSDKRRVTVREFKGKILVDIREFYEDNEGEMKPGRKGISLQLSQWEALKSHITDIDVAIEEMK
ncbi:activated RNA polymerase II transcriptional coactivator p15-like [Stylophora pistillata]|nr:activated RNA polymerase II transcriptional coactivator p15-like [Stylophora pistillata]